MTMRATRDALRRLVAQDSWEKPYANAALAEVEAVEAVVEAARALSAPSMVSHGEKLREIADALARLDALTDGQGSNAAVTDSESRDAAENDGQTAAPYGDGFPDIKWSEYPRQEAEA